MTAPEPSCPADRVPHRDRILEIVRLCPTNKTAGVCIDNIPEHIAYYLQELSKYKEIGIVYEGKLSPEIYLIKVTKYVVN